MSVYMVEYETLNRVISIIKKEEEKPRNYYNDEFGFHYPTINDILSVSTKKYTNLGKRILEMNLDSLYSRYTSKLEPYDDYIAGYKFKEIENLSNYQAIKSINCLLTQCSEGTNPYSQLFRELELMRGKISNRIVSDLEEYKNAEWK